MKAMGQIQQDDVANLLINKMKRLGGKNLSEPDKKFLNAMWMHLRGDALKVGPSGRDMAFLRIKDKLARAMRDFEPAVYFETLPPMRQLKESHRDLYERLFPDEYWQLGKN